jgi:hypothetical protein
VNFLEETKSTFGDNAYRPRITDENLIEYKLESDMEKSIEGKNQFFGDDMTSQIQASSVMTPQSSAQNRRGITWNIPLLEQTWRSSPYAQRAIQWRASNLIIKGVDINTQDDEIDSNELNILQQTLPKKYYRPLKKMFAYGYLYGGSACIKIVRGKTQPDDFLKPFVMKDIAKGDFLGLKTLTRWYQIEPALDKGLVKEVNEEKGIRYASEIGLPLFYRVNFGGGLSGFSGLNDNQIKRDGHSIQGSQILVHRSWIYIFNPFQLGHIETQVERYWSKSILEVASLDLERHEIIWSATAKSAVKNNLGVLNIDGLDGNIRNAHTNKVINGKLELMKYTTAHGVIALGGKDKFVFADSSLAGNEKAIEQSMRQVSLGFGVPVNVMFSDDSKYNESNYLQCLGVVEDTQKSEVAPIIDDLIQIMSMNLFGKEIGMFSFDFKPILTLTPKQKAEVMKIMIDVLDKAHEGGLIDTLTGMEALQDILNNPSNVFSHLNPEYLDMIRKGTDGGDPITANWFKIEMAKALNQNKDNDKGTAGVENPESSAIRVNKGGDPTKKTSIIKRHSLSPNKGKE